MLLLNLKDSLVNFREVSREIFTPKEFNLNVRHIWQWAKWGLINLNDDRKWERYNLIDIIWLKTISFLTAYGLPLEVLKDVKKIIKKNYGCSKSDGLQNLTMALVMRSDIKIIIRHLEQGGLIADVSDAILNSVTDKNELQPTLTIPLLSIVKQIILDLSKNEKHYENILKFGLLSVDELQLLFEVKNGVVKEFCLTKDAGKQIIKNVSCENYLNIILTTCYKTITYSTPRGQVMFNYFAPIINTKLRK